MSVPLPLSVTDREIFPPPRAARAPQGTRWQVLTRTLDEEWQESAPLVEAFRKERQSLDRELEALEAPPSGALATRIQNALKAPSRRLPLTEEESCRAQALARRLAGATTAEDYGTTLAALLLYVVLPATGKLDPERLAPWTAPFISAAIQGQAMIGVADDDAATLEAMRWVQDFAARVSAAGRAGDMPGGEEAWRSLWLPLCGFDITAIDYYSTTVNMAPFVRFFGALRTEAFAACPPPADARGYRVMGDLPTPRPPEDKRCRLALLCSHPTAHGHGLPHFIWWLVYLDRKRFEPVLIIPETGENAAHVALFLKRYPDLQELAPVVVVPESELESLAALDLDVLYNMDDLCRGRPERAAYLRLARRQLTAFYTPATTGCPMMDYYVTSSAMDPRREGAFTEQVVVSEGLPFCVHHAGYFGVTPLLSTRELGIKPETVVLTMGSSMLTKLRPAFAACVARILARVPEAVVVAMPSTKPKDRIALVNVLRRACLKEGVDPGRARFLAAANRSLLHGVTASSDLFLDFFPFSGTNNVLDPLTVGTPCVTLCPPEGYSRNRIASTILAAMGQEDLAVPDEQAYEDLVVRLCRDAGLRARYRARLGHEAMEKSAICDGPGYVARMENLIEGLMKA